MRHPGHQFLPSFDDGLGLFIYGESRMKEAQRLLQIITDLLPDGINLSEMANLTVKQTGISNIVIYVSDRGGSKHNARIKVSNLYNKINKTDLFSVALDDFRTIGKVKITNKELKLIKSWAKLNKEILIQYWCEEISTGDLFDLLKKI